MPQLNKWIVTFSGLHRSTTNYLLFLFLLTVNDPMIQIMNQLQWSSSSMINIPLIQRFDDSKLIVISLDH